jgi:hypothetical protein
MSTPSQLTRQILAGAGTPARQLAAAIGQPVHVVRAERLARGRCAELGHRVASLAEADRDDEHTFWDAVMRSNRSVCG